MDNSSPTESVPPVAKTPSRTKFLIPLLVVAALVIIAAILFVVRIDGDRVWERVAAASSLKGIPVSVGMEEASLTAHRFGVLGVTAVRGEGAVLAQVRKGKHKATIVRLNSGDEEVRLLAPKKMLIAEGALPKGGLAVSKDGLYVAYSIATNPEATRNNLSAWTLHVHNVETGTDTEIGNGYGAQFFERDGTEYILYTTSEGIAFTNPANGSGFITPLRLLDDTLFAAKISDNGAYLAYRDRARRAWNLYDVKKLAPGLPLSISPVPTDIAALSSVYFDGETLLGVLPTWIETEEDRELTAQQVVRLVPGEDTFVPIYGLPTDLTVRFD